ncbi:hypothetical protein EGJ09_16640 [Pseudomonas sp. p106]|nr:hypothetical protein EGJ09_16640 [Pseudomonas sp. p106]
MSFISGSSISQRLSGQAQTERLDGGFIREFAIHGLNGRRSAQWLPEWPKPPVPRWLSSKASTTSKCACTTGTSTS